MFLGSNYSLPSQTPFFLPKVPQEKNLLYFNNGVSYWQISEAIRDGAERSCLTCVVVLCVISTHILRCQQSGPDFRVCPVYGSSHYSMWEVMNSVPLEISPFISFLTKKTLFLHNDRGRWATSSFRGAF